jgi:hypothetical protein
MAEKMGFPKYYAIFDVMVHFLARWEMKQKKDGIDLIIVS